MPKSLLILVGLWCSLAGVSQTFQRFFSANTLPSRHYFFTHYTTASGLASYQVNSTAQDEDGYIWIGTNDGLQRYDGVRYKTFRRKENDSSSLPSNLIWQVLIDKNKNMWVLTIDGKAGIFNTKTFQFSPVAVKPKNEAFYSSNAPFKKMVIDEFGNLFLVIPGNEIIRYNNKTNAFEPAPNLPGYNGSSKIRAFAPQPGTHNYWVFSDESGLGIYNTSTGQLSNITGDAENEKALSPLKEFGHITSLYADKHERLWLVNNVADTPSVSCYDSRKKQMLFSNYHFDTRTLGYHEVRDFFEQKDGTIWIFGQKVFARWLEKERQFEQVHNGYEEEHGIDYFTLTCLLEDREHNMWASTANNGIFRYNPSKDFFSNIKYISHATDQQGLGGPMSFITDRDGSLLVGIREDGLYRFNKNLEQIPLNIKGIPDKNTAVIWSMYPSADSNIIWMSAQRGIYKYDKNKRSATFFQPAMLANKTVRRIIEDYNGNLWLGTQEGGLFKWDAIKGKTRFEDGLSNVAIIPPVRINKILIDRKGYLWVATNSEGAFMMDLKSDTICRHFSLKGTGELKLPEQSALSLVDYNDSLVIIGTNSRLFVYNRIRQTSSLLGSQLSGFNASMEKDDNDHLWVSTTTSIYRVTVSNRVFLQMNRNDGLNNDYFLQGGSAILPDKRMLFGVYGAIIAFLPSAIVTGPMFPDLKITGFTVNDKSLRVDSLVNQKAIVLPPDQNSMVIDLSTMSYNSSYLLKYKLDGIDKEWKKADANSQLIYSYLPPDNYTLNVQTIDADGVIGKKNIHIAIRIKPPFWRTWWFFSSLLLLLALFLFLLDRQRTIRRETIEKMRSNIAGNLHREVNTTLNNINILSEMAKLKADNNPEKSKEFIGQINLKSEHMIVAMDDMLWSIDPANDNMLKTVERLMEFIDMLNNRDNAAITMMVDKGVEKLRVGMQLRHEAFLLIKDFIQVQVQCGGRDISMNISYEKSNLVYTSQFDPAACNLKQLNNQLYSKEMEKRLNNISARFDIANNKSNMLISLKFPI